VVQVWFIAFAVVLAAAALIVPGPMVRLKTMVASSASISILFDLGDGAYDWSPAFVPDPSAVNATWNATLAAAGQLGLDIRWTWYACCGVAVTDVGNRSPPSGFVGLFRWNGTQSRWEFASTGLSTLVLTHGDAIALYNAAFDGVTFAGRYPVPTPLNPYPAIQFRGDASNTGASKSKAPHTLRVLWDHDTGVSEIGSTPSVAYGKVFVNSRNGLFALNDSTGREVWRNPVVRGMSSPAVFDGGLIVGGSDGRVHWVNATSGAERWNVSLLTTPGFSGITSSPKQILDRVYIGTFNESSGSGEVVSFWASNGTIAWRHPTGSVHFSSPAIANGMVYVGVMGTYNRTTGITFDPPFGILAVSAADGSMKWFFPTNDSVAASPLIDGNLVISPSKNGNVYSVNATTGTEIWRANFRPGISSPAEHVGILFVGGGAFGGGGRVTALRALTGQILWTFDPNGPVQSSVSYADGTIVFSTNTGNGTVYSLDAATGDVVWQFEPSPAQYILGSPSIADGMVFAPSDNGHVYAITNVNGTVLNVTVEQPSRISDAEDAPVNITVAARFGAVTNVTLNVTFVARDVVPQSPTPVNRSGLSFIWKFGAIPFGAIREIRVVVKGLCVPPPLPPGSGPITGCGTTEAVASIHATSADLQGDPFPDAIYLYKVDNWATTGPPVGVFPVGSAIALLVVGVVIALAVLTVLVTRRKRRGL